MADYFDYASNSNDWTAFEPENIPNEVVLRHPLVQELTDALEMGVGTKIQIPYIIKNRKLMSEGKWNDYFYPANAIRKAYENTDWSDKRVVALYLNHSDNDAGAWVGEIRNPRMKGSDLYGDLVIYDPNLAIKLAYGKPKFGISPKVRGDANNRVIEDFVYENFSIVVNPAVKTTYLNKDNKKLYGGIYINQEEESVMAEEEKKEEPVQEAKPAQTETEEVKETPAEEPKTEKTEEAKTETTEAPAEGEKKEETVEEMAKKKKKEYPYPEADIKAKMSEYTDFVKKFLKDHPEADFADAAEAWKKKKKMNEMSEDELINALEEVLSQLKKKKYPYPEKDKKLSQVVEKMSEKIKKLEEKLAEPDKTVIQAELSETGPKSWDESFMKYLQGRCI